MKAKGKKRLRKVTQKAKERDRGRELIVTKRIINEIKIKLQVERLRTTKKKKYKEDEKGKMKEGR